MSYAAPTQPQPVITLPEEDRIAFMGRVYQHLGLALAAFVAFEFLLFSSGLAERIYDFVAGSGAAWLLILGGFMVGGWLTTQATFDLTNPGRQYAGLFGQAALYSIIFAPFLHLVFTVEGGGDVWTAAVITGLGFAGLSATAWVTRRDLSFIRPLLIWGGVAALLLIVGAVLFGAQLGTWFSVGMIALMGASILYNTQQILHRYPADAHVGAAVNLFGSLMTMFWYVLSLVSSR
jgi:FtsH-binding integral membrane protein